MSLHQLPFKSGSLLFAPMEGVTDEIYRQTLDDLYPEWDYLFTDFLRIPQHGQMSSKKVAQHFGHTVLNNNALKRKTGYQVLTSHLCHTETILNHLCDLNITHLDLNLGCPSKKVNAHFGGAYLLGHLEKLQSVVQDLRARFPLCFTVKIRTGYRDDGLFESIIECLNRIKVDAITVHARTRDQLYKGSANWSKIKKAVEISDVPIIGNGDIWTCQDIDEMFEQTHCYAVMCARGALKTPWLAELYRSNTHTDNEAYLLELRKGAIIDYFENLKKNYRKASLDDSFLLNRFKGLTRYLFDDFDQGSKFRSNLLRSPSLDEFEGHLATLDSLH